MKNYFKFVETRVLQLTSLTCATMIVVMFGALNFENVLIEYNDTVFSIQVNSWITEEQLLGLTPINNQDVRITSKEKQNTNTVFTVSDTFDVQINDHGDISIIQTTKGTVQDILDEAGYTLSDKDFTCTALNQVITEDADINITRVTTKTIEETVEIEHKTVKRSSSKIDLGTTKVVTDGENGQKKLISEIVYHNGVEVSSHVVSEQVLKAPVTEIVEYGSFNVNRGVTHRDGKLVTPSGKVLNYSKVIDVQASAYSTEGWSSKYTASGTLARVGAIAVDPRVIPLGSKLYITSADGKSWIYGTAVAEDTGGAIKGNKIDLFFNTQRECIQFGRKQAKVYVLS